MVIVVHFYVHVYSELKVIYNEKYVMSYITMIRSILNSISASDYMLIIIIFKSQCT